MTGRRRRRLSEGPSIRSSIRSMLVWVLVVVGLAMGANIAITVVTDGAVDTVLHSLEPLKSANATVLQALTNAETGVRGYQLTGRTAFLQPYRQGLSVWPVETARALRLARGDERATRLVLSERSAARRWVSAFAEPIVNGTPPRLGHSLESFGKRLFDEVRRANGAVAGYVDERARLAGQAVTTGTFVKVLLLVLTTLLIIGMVLYRGLNLRRLLVVPLESLAESLAGYRRGERWRRVDTEHGPVETREVARTINALAEDISGLEAARARRERLRNLSLTLSRRLRDRLELQALLTDSVRDVGTALSLDRVVIRLAEKDGTIGPPAAHWDDPSAPPLTSELAGPAAYGADAFEADRSGRRAIVSNDLDNEPLRDETLQEWFRRNHVGACVIYPLETEDSMLGALAVSTAKPRLWSEDELDILETAADDLARALSHAQLYESERRIVAELKELDRAKSDFLSTVSHELRTPLTSINGYVELLTDGDAGPVTGEQEKMLSIVGRNVARLRGLIEDLLTLSRIEVGSFRTTLTPVDLAPALRNAVVSMAPQAADKGVSLLCDVDVSTGPLVVEADPVQFDRVIDNLLSNAVKFTPRGGRVRLAARPETGSIVIVVSDTGIGIAKDEQAELFTRFFRASNAVDQAIPGTGLGLSIVRAIVEQHGGSISLASLPGEGTTVTITLPPAAAGRPSQEAKSSGVSDS